MTMRVYDAGGNFLVEFPYFVTMMVLDCVNDVGSFTFNWNLNSPGGSNLISDTDLQMAVCMDFRDGNGYTEVARYLYEQDTYDPSMSESAIIQANGRSIVALLDQALIYPQGGVGSQNTSWSFSGATPGKIMNDLINAAKARGCFPFLTTSFTSGHDSSGNAWTQSFTNAYSAGQSLLTTLLALAQGGLCDFNMTGTTLNLYNPNTTLATDRSSTVCLRRNREILDVPYQRDRTQIGTVMLAIGDNGVNVERTAGTLGTIGRREKYLSQGGVTDTGTLNYWADQNLGSIDDQKISLTPSYPCDITLGTPVPWKDYHPGDYISIDLSGTMVKYRARQWSVQCTTGGPTTIQPTLNDVFYDQNVLLQGRMTALSGSVTGTSTIVNLPGPNATIPNPPAFTPASIYTGAYYSPATGTTLAQLELQWATPTNTDGSIIADGESYLIQYRISTTPIYPLAWSQLQGKSWSSLQGNPWTNPLATPQNTQWTSVTVPFDNNNTIISGLICGETYEFQIATTDVSGNTSLFSGISSFATATDNVAPSTPDAPTVSASMVAVQVMHDLGRATGGTYNLEQDLDHLEVHYSYDPAFTPVPGITSSTYLGKLIANAGMMAAKITAVGTFQVTSTTGIYIKVIAVDESGNTSPASNGSGVTAVLIDDQHISSLSVSKLLAGTVMASIVLGGTIATALSGQRCAMDSTGFHSYDANGNLLFDVNNSSSQLTLGAIGGVGKVVVDTNPVDVYPQIRFYDSTNTNYGFILVSGLNGNTAGLAMSSGTYTNGGNTLADRVILDGSGSTLQVIDAVSQAPRGGSINAGPGGINIAVYSNSFSADGGSLQMSHTQTLLGLFPNGATHGGQLIFNYDSTNSDATIEIDGYWPNAAAAPAAGTFLIDFGPFSSGTGGASVSYGPTMYSIVAPIVQYSCSTTGATGGNVNTTTTTGCAYTLSGSSPGAWNMFVLGMRLR